MNVQLEHNAPDTPMRRQRTDSVSSATSLKRMDLLSAVVPAKPPSKTGRWTRDLFSWKAISSTEARTGEDFQLGPQEASFKDGLRSLVFEHDEEEIEEETEVFLGLDDI